MSVCLSVCLLDTFVSPAKTAESIVIPVGADVRRPKEPNIGEWWGRFLRGKDHFSEVVPSIEKHWETLLRCTQQKGSFNRQ